MPKEFKSNIVPMTEKRLAAMLRPHPFKRCESCGNSIISTACYCGECLKLTEYHMAPAVKRFQASNDTQQKQSFPSDNHKGYRHVTE